MCKSKKEVYFMLLHFYGRAVGEKMVLLELLWVSVVLMPVCMQLMPFLRSILFIWM